MLRILEGDLKRSFYSMRGDLPEPESLRSHQIVKDKGTGPQNAPFFKSLFKAEPLTRLNRNMAVDGSVTPVRFNLDIPEDQIYVMSRFILSIRSGQKMAAGGWGSEVTPLPVGMTAGVTVNGVDICFTPIPWQSHFDLADISYSLTHHAWGVGDEFVVMRLSLHKSGTNLRLDGSTGDTFWMQVNDDLTYLTEQSCMCQGLVENVLLR